MACYKKHVFMGCVWYICAIVLYRPVILHPMQALEWLLCSIVGSLFPDIDIKSKGQTLVYGLFFIAISGLLLLHCVVGAALAGLMVCVPILVKHRGIFHQLWFLAIVLSGITGILISVCPLSQRMRLLSDAVFFLLGIMSHLVLDGKLRYRSTRRYR